MSNEIIVRQELTPTVWQMIQEIAPAMQDSRLFGTSSSEAAMAIMLKGYELGLSFTASFEFVHVIEGKPSLSPRGALALVQQSPNFDGMKITDDSDKCTVWMRRKNGFEYTASFSMEDAKRAGLIKKGGGWEKYPANMLRWRAVGYCIDIVFPDIIGGMKRTDELGDEITPEGDVLPDDGFIAPDWGTVEPISDEPAVLDYGKDLAWLLENADEADILVVNNNEFPVTPEQINSTIHGLVEIGVLIDPLGVSDG
jgi:hypothetical protein